MAVPRGAPTGEEKKNRFVRRILKVQALRQCLQLQTVAHFLTFSGQPAPSPVVPFNERDTTRYFRAILARRKPGVCINYYGVAV